MTLHKGWFSDTLPGFAEEHGEPVRLLNIDCDIYSSTRTIFDNLGRFIQPGSILIFDEYGFYPGWEEHEHKAFLEFLQEHNWGSELLAYSCSVAKRSFDYLSLRGRPFPREPALLLVDFPRWEQRPYKPISA